MVDERPVREAACVAQVAQVVAVAPQLLGQLGVGHRRAGRVLVDRVAVLCQLGWEVAQVLQHLQTETGQ